MPDTEDNNDTSLQMINTDDDIVVNDTNNDAENSNGSDSDVGRSEVV